MSPPVPGASIIPRLRLDHWFERANFAALCVLRAPAGFGKTTMMVQLLEKFAGRGRRIAWLSLDEADNDFGRFIAGMLAALQKIDPALDPTAFERDSFEKESALLNILDWFATFPEPVALFLDDFEVIHSPAIHSLLKRLALDLPPQRLIVVGTRELPDLGLGRLRVSGRLLEIGQDDLRFAAGEAMEFLCGKRGLNLDADDVVRLNRNTEGWAAALQLAALALSKREDPKAFIDSFTGANTDIAEYFAEEVLSQQPPEVREFLLKTCVLDLLGGPLCDAVAGGHSGHFMLSRLERANLFLIPLDEERRWYRFHHVFSKFLRERLEEERPGEARNLNRLAAGWYETKGMLDEAAKHAFRAGDLDLAAGYAARCALALVRRGQVSTVQEWMNRLPKETLADHPELSIALCWSMTFRHQHREANLLFEKINAELKPGLMSSSALIDLYALGPLVFSLTDRVQECMRLAEENLPRCSDRESFSYGVLLLMMSRRLMESVRFEEAERSLRASRENSRITGSALCSIYADSFAGELRFLQGRLREALALYSSANSTAGRNLPGHTVLGALTCVFLAQALYERGEISEALAMLLEVRDLFSECIPIDVMLIGYITLARIFHLKGEGSKVEELLSEAAHIGRERELPRVAATIHLERIRLLLQDHDVEGAARLAASEDHSRTWRSFEGWGMPASDPESPEVSRLRLLIGRGRGGEALSGLKAQLEGAQSLGRGRYALKLRILLARAQSASGDTKLALRTIREALLVSAPEGFVMTFAEEGREVTDLVRSVREGLADGQGELSAQLDRILACAGAARAPVRAGTEERPAEELTSREVEVLRMAASGYSNQMLADHLYVSVPTVKFHLRNINLKLHASNRTEAIAKARGFGLIE